MMFPEDLEPWSDSFVRLQLMMYFPSLSGEDRSARPSGPGASVHHLM